MHSVPRPELTALQTAALRMRFEQLRDRVAVLGAMADERYRHTVWPAFRYGGSAIMQFADYLVRHVAGGEERFHALHPGRMSSDVLFLAGRLRAAQARGDVDELDPGPALRARKAEFD